IFRCFSVDFQVYCTTINLIHGHFYTPGNSKEPKIKGGPVNPKKSNECPFLELNTSFMNDKNFTQ
ncbi:MAG: hypothetical protein COY39_05020, partial [Alphaproteobacteria bacterium CG_4_10_14_0_8_um_filter_37_21]